MKEIIDSIGRLPSFQAVLEEAETSKIPASLGLIRSARLPTAAALQHATQRPILLLSERMDHALTLVDEMQIWMKEQQAMYFPEPAALFYENAPWGENTRRERLFTLAALAANMIPGSHRTDSYPLMIAPARAVMARTLPRRLFIKATRLVKLGQSIEMEKLTSEWVRSGYENVNAVVTPGSFARRGGILDIWPQTGKFPTRIEFFGDEIESLRYFDPASQRTVRAHESLLIPPAREILVEQDHPLYEAGGEIREFHLPLIHDEVASILHYLPKETLVLVDNWVEFESTVNELEEQAIKLKQDYIEEGAIKPDHPLPYITLAEIHDMLSTLTTLELGPSGLSPQGDYAKNFRTNQRFGGKLKDVIDHIHTHQQGGDQVVVVSRQAARLQDVWQESLRDEPVSSPNFVEGSLTEGWLLVPEKSQRTLLLTDGEIFGWQRPQPRLRPRVAADAPETPYVEFAINAMVVHVDHGIGRFKGLVKRKIEGVQHEYFRMEYGGGDQLYVPVHQADRLTSYIGAKGHRPRISRLSGSDWRSVKSKVKKAVQAVAEDLLELYAQRQVAEGYAYQLDSPWQKELEASFPYIETQDQLRVLEEVKGDMENARPMDRLICGDVGYGKTEVALRAAFKAVMDGKQVALLVPTTILAQQHYRTFRQRLAAFPVGVEMLSRFRTPAEQRTILYDLSVGALDIVIGTHRLVQGDINFKDLGLIIIDEEQRFGVTHKEHLKKMRTEVDVLTMTATPIPRTLYMALTGVRDISTINTPPEERLPIQTHVGPYDAKLVRQAILREMERGGQIFFVHNRVQTIAGVKNQINRLVPEAKIEIAHGQMNEKDLAQRMREFTNGEIDILLSTSIIESGLDIPNANTLIIDRADMFGLAQLYQLRGRVGRGAQRAYAYFFRHRTRQGTDESRLRLETLAENTQLGAGFSIAMRDLEIRGAGDFLGTRQHGQIASVGLNLYTKLLTQAVNQIKTSGELPKGSLSASIAMIHPIISIDLPLVVTIPESYIPDSDLRLKLYRRLADIYTLEEIDALKEEFSDRFGKPPEHVENLFYQLHVRILSEKAGLASMGSENNKLTLRFPDLPEGMPPRKIPPLGRDVRTGKKNIWVPLGDEDVWKKRLIEILETLGEGVPSISV